MKKTLVRLVPWALAAVIVGWLTKASQPNSHITFIAPFAARPLIASDALTFYFSKVIFPVNLAPDYGRNPAAFLQSNWKWITWAVPPLLFLVLRRRARETRAAFAVFLVALIPVLGFVPFYFQEFSTVADRYLYLAMLGPALLLAREASLRKSRVAAGCVAAYLVVLCLTARHQANHWRDSTALFRHTIRVNPDSLLAHNNLGTLLENKETWLEAAYHYKEVIRIDPENLAGHYNFGRLLARLSRYDMAEEEFRKVLLKEEAIPDAQYGLGMVYLRTKKIEKAKSHLFLALKYRPGHPMTLAQIGNAFREESNCQEALRYFDASLQRDPDLAEGNFGKGQCLLKAGNGAQAALYFEKAVRREPEWEAPQQALVAMRKLAPPTKR